MTGDEIEKVKPTIKGKLRNSEYYNMQPIFDNLYKQSSEGSNFKSLYNTIISENNIKLAYRNLKTNKGSLTKGVDNKEISYFSNMSTDELVNYVRKRLANFTPHTIKRVFIPKDDGKTRPLGIPTIEDRLIQQCILQVLEPICEAKFYNHSYGFRPNRSTHHAIARAMSLINMSKMNYVVDIDIKGFFDNINHSKLLKQIWSLGIRDKKLISIISKMLKAPIHKEGINDKGTPQGGILSPLLSNIVLNELDWWIASQWEYMPTKTKYKDTKTKKDGSVVKDNTIKYKTLRRSSKLKEIYIVRYADDFKIFCNDYPTAVKIFNAVKDWLKTRLHLDISPEKSKITNLRKEYTEFLGIKMKAEKKGNKYVVKSHMSDKCKKKLVQKFKHGIDKLAKNCNPTNVNKYNASVLGRQNYYSVASHVSLDFKEIDFLVRKHTKNKLKKKSKKKGKTTALYDRIYKDYNHKKRFVCDIPLFPIYAVKNNPPMNFSQTICDYTELGRTTIYKKLQASSINDMVLEYLLNNPDPRGTVAYNDNRISLYTGQRGKCAITGLPLDIGFMEVHHKKPKSKGGTDDYKNLMYLNKDIHNLIHMTDPIKIQNVINLYKLDAKQIVKINKLRKLADRFILTDK